MTAQAGAQPLPGGLMAEPALQDILTRFGATMRPLVPNAVRQIEMLRVSPTGESPDVQAYRSELAQYYRVDAPDDSLDALQDELLANRSVAAAFFVPMGSPPAQVIHRINLMTPTPAPAPAATPDFTNRQAYLGAAPAGVDANYAWTRAGGDGRGVAIIDLEWAWTLDHEDLQHNNGGLAGGTAADDPAHGTAVLGVFHGGRNAFGITGIAPESSFRVYAFSAGQPTDTAPAIHAAADLLQPGDIILLEIHRPGPNATQDPSSQYGFIPIEWWPPDCAAIQYAAGRGIVVVEAGGNGAQDLDDAVYDRAPKGFPNTWVNPFRRTGSDSGAIVVGAGSPPPGTHGRTWITDRARLDFSNFGSCVDVQGWGREVTSAGYGDLQGGTEQQYYTDEFAGTSSASPMIVGVLACAQGALKAAGKALLNPRGGRALLRATGSPQQADATAPLSQRIGSRPDLRAILDMLKV
jgi:hypothetical protein